MKNNIPELNDKMNIFGKIAEVFLERFRITYLLMAFIIFFGMFTYQNIPKESVPEISMNMGIVNVVYPGASADDMEMLVTNILEDKINGLDDVEEINSTTKAGSSLLMIQYGFDVEMIDVIDDLRSAVDEVNLPDDALDPFVDYYRSDLVPLMSLSITGDYKLSTLKEVAEKIESEIETIVGIDEVEVYGGLEKEVEIVLNENKLMEYGITKDMVANIIRAKNINIPSGSENLDGLNYNIRLDELYLNIEEIKNTIIMIQGNKSIFIKDVADVNITEEEATELSTVYMNTFDAKESRKVIFLNVYRSTNSDMIGPATDIYNIIEDGKGSLYPENVIILVSNDTSEIVKEDMVNVLGSALSGLLVVIVVLFLFIGLREATIVSFVIPLSVFTAIIMMDTVGITFNVISSTGIIISLGLLVDNAIVVMENVDRMRDKKMTRKLAAKVALNQVAPAVFAATLTTIAAFIPLALTPGMMGDALKQIPLTIMFALGTSFIVSVVITPVLSSRFLETYKKVRHENMTKIKNIASIIFVFIVAVIAFSIGGEVGVFSISMGLGFAVFMFIKDKYFINKPHFISTQYSLIVKGILESKLKKGLVLLTAFLLLVGSFSLMATGIIKSEFMPYETPSGATITIEGPSYYRLSDTKKVLENIENVLFEYNDIKSFNSTIGGDDQNTGSITIDFLEKEDMVIDANEIIGSIRSELQNISGAFIKIEAIGGMGRQAISAPVEIIITSSSYDEAAFVGEKIFAIVENTEGIVGADISNEPGMPELRIQVKEIEAAAYGLTSAEIGSKIRTIISGENISVLRDGTDEIDIRLKFDYEISTIKDLENMIFYKNGNIIPFNIVADIVEDSGANKITHRDGEIAISVTAGLDKEYNPNEVTDIIKAEIAKLNIGGTNIEFGGENEEMESVFSDMTKNFMVAVALVYIILSLQFNSLSQPIVILISLPMALIGVFAGLFITNINFGTYAFMGIVALVGIAVNDAIVLIDYANYRREHGDSIVDATVETVKTRFIPVFATSITTIGGIMPLTINNETMRQLGVSLIFGLVASTILTLLIIPIVYVINEKLKIKIKNKLNIFKEEVLENE